VQSDAGLSCAPDRLQLWTRSDFSNVRTIIEEASKVHFGQERERIVAIFHVALEEAFCVFERGQFEGANVWINSQYRII
jgi:hypothetical protein